MKFPVAEELTSIRRVRTLGLLMPLRVLIIPDKFKGTLSAHLAAKAIARGWRRARPRDELRLLPMSDGGDGFGAVLGVVFGANVQVSATVDATHRPCRSKWWWDPGNRVALIESATVIGLAMLQLSQRRPFELDTFGLGALLKAAFRKGARQCLVGIGGSATNDGGFGFARALGWRFLDRRGREIVRWTELRVLARISPPARLEVPPGLVVAMDVQNPLLGARGTSRVYGPQKGLRPQDFPRAEACLRRLAQVVHQQLGRNYAELPGAGAAGGLGFGLAAFARGRLQPGFEVFSQLARLERHLRWADLVITGEGAIDRSTLMGKGVGQIVRRCRDLRIPCIGLGGMVSDPSSLFAMVRGLTELATLNAAKRRPAFWLERLARETAAAWPAKTCARVRPG